MTLSETVLRGKPRFEALLRGRAAAMHDQPLLERPDWLVAPTLGAIVPNWLLIIPRRPSLSFRDWFISSEECLHDILRSVRDHLGLSAEETIWFEHGPCVSGTLVGCGLDHAHIHMLVKPAFTFEAFAAQAQALADLAWQAVPAENVYSRVEEGASYYIAGSGDCVMTASNVERAGSQFFRRVVASLAGSDSRWNYRSFAHADNIACTVQTFKSLESAARRAR